jgi:hypothetical protein
MIFTPKIQPHLGMASGNLPLEITAILAVIYGNKSFLTSINELICLTKVINAVILKTVAYRRITIFYHFQ